METESQLRRFTSVGHAQRFLSVHGPVRNLFRVGRHVLRAAHHRLRRTRAFVAWDAVTCACWLTAEARLDRGEKRPSSVVSQFKIQTH